VRDFYEFAHALWQALKEILQRKSGAVALAM